MRYPILFLAALAIVFTACNNNDSTEALAEVQQIEAELFNTDMSVKSVEKAEEAATKFMEFAKNYPADSLAPDFGRKAADIQLYLGKREEAIESFQYVIENFENYYMNDYIMLKIGTVANDDLGDTVLAKKYFEMAIEKYPESPYAKDAEYGLSTLGMTLEEQMKAIEAKLMQQDTLNTAEKE